jgi:hypothetical protein
MLEVNELSKATVEDLASNPKKYGLPTIEEFARDPERFRAGVTSSDLMAQIDRGSQMLNRHVTHHEYWVGEYRCESLEAADRMLSEMGIAVTAHNFKPEVIDTGAGKCKVKVTFKLPDE